MVGLLIVLSVSTGSVGGALAEQFCQHSLECLCFLLNLPLTAGRSGRQEDLKETVI